MLRKATYNRVSGDPTTPAKGLASFRRCNACTRQMHTHTDLSPELCCQPGFDLLSKFGFSMLRRVEEYIAACQKRLDRRETHRLERLAQRPHFDYFMAANIDASKECDKLAYDGSTSISAGL